MRQKCYLSYDWSNKPSITYILELFKYNIEKLSFNAVRVIWDEDFHNGENFKEKEKEIRECDSVIIFATPEYKQSVEEADENRGVYREYKYILETKNTKGIKVLCVLISGKVKEAIPREFRDDIAADFSAHQFYYTNKRGRHYVSKEYKNSFRNFITDIIYETEQSSRRKEYHFASKEEAYRTMFVETEDKRKLPREAMFKPEIYTDIFEGIASGVVVGRKGSGKTTLFSVLENYDRERFDRCFKVLRPISAEFIKESYIYNYYQEFSNDVIALEANDILVLFWKIYLYLCTLYIVCIEEEKNRIRDNRRADFHNASVKLRREFKVEMLDSQSVSKAIFTKSVDLWYNFIKEDIIDYSTETSYMPSIVANLTVDRVMQKFWGNRLYHKLINDISICEKKVMLALDNFNEVSDDFRRRAKAEMNSGIESSIQHAIEKVEFDGLLYRTLVTTIDELKTSTSGLIREVAFCVIIPQDRVDQICLVDRDFSKRHFYHLSWDAIELLALVLLRLRIMFDYEFDPERELDQDPEGTFAKAMNRFLPSIPTEIEINVGGGLVKKIGIFQYILRSSFWRPRDIIKYFAVLIDIDKKTQRKKEAVDNATLKDMLYRVTEDIITTEFYCEFDKVIYNISDFLIRLRNKNIIMPYSEISMIVSRFRFQGASIDSDMRLIDRMEILYEIGVFGLMINPQMCKKNNIYTQLNFSFTEGMSPFYALYNTLIEDSSEVQVVINPIFQKKYSLQFNTTDLIADYSWDYLANNHIRKKSIDRP